MDGALEKFFLACHENGWQGSLEELLRQEGIREHSRKARNVNRDHAFLVDSVQRAIEAVAHIDSDEARMLCAALALRNTKIAFYLSDLGHDISEPAQLFITTDLLSSLATEQDSNILQVLDGLLSLDSSPEGQRRLPVLLRHTRHAAGLGALLGVLISRDLCSDAIVEAAEAQPEQSMIVARCLMEIREISTEEDVWRLFRTSHLDVVFAAVYCLGDIRGRRPVTEKAFDTILHAMLENSLDAIQIALDAGGTARDENGINTSVVAFVQVRRFARLFNQAIRQEALPFCALPRVLLADIAVMCVASDDFNPLTMRMFALRMLE